MSFIKLVSLSKAIDCASQSLGNTTRIQQCLPQLAFLHNKAHQGDDDDGQTEKPQQQKEQSPSQPDPFDLEFDRFNGGAYADAHYSPPEPLGRPVDINFELDMDDPEAIDLNALYSEEEESPDEEEEILLAREVDLDDEYDLIHDKIEGVPERESILGEERAVVHPKKAE